MMVSLTLYIANIRKCNNQEFQVIGQAAKVAKVVINTVSKIGSRESPSIPNYKFYLQVSCKCFSNE